MDFLRNIVLSPITKGIDHYLSVDHYLSLNENMKKLRRKCKRLNQRKEDIETKLKTKLKPGKKVKKEVKQWLIAAQRIDGGKQSIEKQVEQHRGYVEGSHLGKIVALKIEEVDEHYQNSSFSDGLVLDAPPGKGAMFPITELAGETTAVRKLEEIWTCLIGNDDVRKIGVSGIGGGGKSIIIKHINNRILERTDKFDRAIWITVSKPLDLNLLQNEIAGEFGVAVLTNHDVTRRAAELFGILKEEKKYVLILDNMCQAFNLCDVGIPEPTSDNGCKMILTTRSHEVCRRMNCQDIRVELLSEEEAWNFFLDTVGRDLLSNPRLEKIMKLVAKECDCLPLGIITIAGRMKGVDDECEWRTALDELRNSTTELIDTRQMFEKLKQGYDHLNCERLKRCFLYCALYPKGHVISREDLIVRLIVEGIIEETSMQQAFDKGHSMLNELEDVCLLEMVQKDNFGNKTLKMHHLIRAMALQIMDPECMVKAGVFLTDLPDEGKWGEDLKMVSLMDNQMSDFGGSPRCSRLSTLLLSYNQTLDSIMGSFFVHMHGLRVLDFSHTGIAILPDIISDLENLTALLLRGCQQLRHVPSLAKLVALMMLDLRNTDIREVPQGMEMLVKLKFLYLSTKHLIMLPRGILPKLSHLQSLIVDSEEVAGQSLIVDSEDLKVKTEELAGLTKLENLEWKLADLHDLSIYAKSFQGRGPSKYNLLVRAYCFDGYRGIEGKSRRVVIKGCRGGEDLFVLPNNVQYLYIGGCNDLICLRDVSSSSSSSGIPVQSLEVLQLNNLCNLSVLIRGGGASPPPPGTFSCLGVLEIFACGKLKKLFTLGLLLHLQKLVTISVKQCDELEDIIAAEEEEEEGMGETSHHSIVPISITLPMLKSLYLQRLPELKSIVCSKGMMVCDNLQSISILDCPELNRLPLSLPVLNGQPCPYHSLQRIKVSNQKWWETLEWDQPTAKDVLQPLVQIPSLDECNLIDEMPGHALDI